MFAGETRGIRRLDAPPGTKTVDVGGNGYPPVMPTSVGMTGYGGSFHSRGSIRGREGDYLSRHMATPMPPPMHSVARPFLASRFCISCTSVVSTRAPDAPIG